MSILSNLIARINRQTDHLKKNIYSEIALETYTRCLPFHYKKLIRTKNIAESIKVVTMGEQFDESSRNLNSKSLPKNLKEVFQIKTIKLIMLINE